MTDKPAMPGSPGNLQRLRLLATDTIVYGVAAAINKSFSLILFPFLTRALSVEDYGRLDFALYAATLVGVIILWGQDSAVARLFFEDEETADRQQMISQALVVMTCNFAVAMVVLFVLARTSLWGEAFGAHTTELTVLLFLYAPLSGLLSFCQGVLKWTFQRNRYIAVALGVPAANLALILLFARRGDFGPEDALAVMVGVGAVTAALALFLIRRWLVRPRGRKFARKLIPLALPYGVIACIGVLSPLFERMVVSGRFGADDLGIYAAAAKIASLAMMLAAAFQMAWGPFSYSIYKQANAARTYNIVLRAFTALMCFTVLALSALAEPVTTLLAGDRYRSAALFAFPLAMAFGVQAIGWITEIGIHLSKRTYLNLIGYGCFLAISLGSMLYLSRAIGILGVPVGALAGQIAMLTVSAAVAQRAFPIGWHYRLPAATLSITLASGAAAAAARFLSVPAPPWWFYLTGMVTIAALNASFGLDRGDRARLSILISGILTRTPAA